MEKKKKINKGHKMEEILRQYFLELGYYVVRGIKFKYQNFEITDIDLWLYMRPSSITRERINVDIKNKKTPQAIERIFWTIGVREALSLDSSIVVTTDKRPAVREFGLINGITVLDGTFLARLSNSRRFEESESHRLIEEDFISLIEPANVGKLGGDWKGILENSKTRLLNQLNFSGCNAWLGDIKYFIDKVMIESNRKDAACRAFYLILSYFILGIDYILKDISFFDVESKALSLKDGFKHGDLGKAGIEEVLSTAMKIVEAYLPNGSTLATQLKINISEAFDKLPVDILKEYFSRNETSKALFPIAKQLEDFAYSKIFVSPTKLPPQLQSLTGVILDYFEVDRRKFFECFQSETVQKSNVKNK
jgi:hypothetical protein